MLLQHFRMFFFPLGVVVVSFTSPNIIRCITTTNETNMQQPISFLLLAQVYFGLHHRRKTDFTFQQWGSASLAILGLKKLNLGLG